MKYGVNFTTTSAYFEVEAEDDEEAIAKAEDELFNSLIGEFDWDCNECMELEEE